MPTSGIARATSADAARGARRGAGGAFLALPVSPATGSGDSAAVDATDCSAARRLWRQMPHDRRHPCRGLSACPRARRAAASRHCAPTRSKGRTVRYRDGNSAYVPPAAFRRCAGTSPPSPQPQRQRRARRTAHLARSVPARQGRASRRRARRRERPHPPIETDGFAVEYSTARQSGLATADPVQALGAKHHDHAGKGIGATAARRRRHRDRAVGGRRRPARVHRLPPPRSALHLRRAAARSAALRQAASARSRRRPASHASSSRGTTIRRARPRPDASSRRCARAGVGATVDRPRRRNDFNDESHRSGCALRRQPRPGRAPALRARLAPLVRFAGGRGERSGEQAHLERGESLWTPSSI